MLPFLFISFISFLLFSTSSECSWVFEIGHFCHLYHLCSGSEEQSRRALIIFSWKTGTLLCLLLNESFSEQPQRMIAVNNKKVFQINMG